MQIHKELQCTMKKVKKEVHTLFEEKIAKADNDYYLSQKWKEKGYAAHGYKTKKVMFLTGEMHLKRRYYYNKQLDENKGFFYIDDLYGIERYKRLGKDVAEYVYNHFGDMTNARIARELGVSRQTVYNILKQLGMKKIQEQVISNYELDTIYIQADEDHNKLQVKSGRGRSIQARVVTIYEGHKRVCKGRNKLVGKKQFFFSSKESTKHIWTKIDDYVQSKYPNVRFIYFGSDAGNWIKTAFQYLDEDKLRYVYDKFHLEKNLTTIYTRSHENRRLAYSYIKQHDAYNFTVLYYNHIKETNRDKKYIHKAFMTIINNWDAVLRNYTLPYYYGTSAEGQVSHYLARHLSSRPKAFTAKQFASYLQLLEYKANGVDFDTYTNAKDISSTKDYYVVSENNCTYGDVDLKSYDSSNVPIFNYSSDTDLRSAFKRIINSGIG